MVERELQLEVQRFSSRLVSRLADAFIELGRSSDRNTAAEATKMFALNFAHATDIAVGPSAVVNTLDFVVFVHLSRRVVETHWVPNVFHEAGKPLAEAYVAAEEDVWNLARRVLDISQETELRALIDRWRADHPGQVWVGSVRFGDFTDVTGNPAPQAAKARGLLSSVRSASHTADEAMLLAERGIFLVNRIPFLIRFQIESAVHTVLADAIHRLADPTLLATDLKIPVARLTGTTHRLARRGIATVAALAVGFCVVFWGGYYVAKRALGEHEASPPASATMMNVNPK